MRRVVAATGGLIALIALALGCATTPNPRQERIIGTFAEAGGRGPVQVPDIVSAGEPFTVRVFTAGGGCVTKGETEVARIETNTVRVTPYDNELVGEDIVCTMEYRVLEHTATVTFGAPGTAQVLVVGRERRDAEPVTIQRTVEVR